LPCLKAQEHPKDWALCSRSWSSSRVEAKAGVRDLSILLIPYISTVYDQKRQCSSASPPGYISVLNRNQPCYIGILRFITSWASSVTQHNRRCR
jgi:hypothetical protein